MSENQGDPAGAIGGAIMALFMMFVGFLVFTEGCVKGKPMPRMNLFQRVEPQCPVDVMRREREAKWDN